ncbi:MULTISPECIES: site-specific integrase [Ureibacillus]|uniref:site-specific integrase n=1 Tax=Ureibacillus TaxID=160795 RepID=UPI000305EEB0|nr:site-specific integrase [Ureibacillus thermosphaericus]
MGQIKGGKPQEVEPIKSLKDIKKVKQFLLGKDNKRDYALFTLGINIGLRASDLLQLKIIDVIENNRVKDHVVITEQKTGKVRSFELNKSAKECIDLYLDSLPSYSADDYLFKSRKGTNEPLTVRSLHKIIKETMKELGIRGNYGTHSLRKTFGYHVYAKNVADNPMILPTLQKMFNHSSQEITLRYIGITKDVIRDVYNGLNL